MNQKKMGNLPRSQPAFGGQPALKIPHQISLKNCCVHFLFVILSFLSCKKKQVAKTLKKRIKTSFHMRKLSKACQNAPHLLLSCRTKSPGLGHWRFRINKIQSIQRVSRTKKKKKKSDWDQKFEDKFEVQDEVAVDCRWKELPVMSWTHRT